MVVVTLRISQGSKPGLAELEVGWSCVHVHKGEIPITWLAEIIAIATGHEGGIVGFLNIASMADQATR